MGSELQFWKVSSWQKWWSVARNLILLAAVYLAGSWVFWWDLTWWLWVTMEAVRRYFPLWLQLVVVVFLGWQLDVLYSWPFGVGSLIVLLLLTWIELSSRSKDLSRFILWRLLGWSIFHFGWWSITTPVSFRWWIWQTIAYLMVSWILWYRGEKLNQ